jgi:hypothetical protein
MKILPLGEKYADFNISGEIPRKVKVMIFPTGEKPMSIKVSKQLGQSIRVRKYFPLKRHWHEQSVSNKHVGGFLRPSI